jgi:hypothetical protein
MRKDRLDPLGSATIEVSRGTEELHRLLREQTFDLRALDVAEFRVWLERHLAHWQSDPAFVQRVRIRELRRGHPRLLLLEHEHQRAVQADAASAEFSALESLDRSLLGTSKAISGLSEALVDATPEKRQSLQQKLDTFQASHRALAEEQTRLIQASPERQALLRIRSALQECRSAVGLDHEDACLAQLLRQRGRLSSRVGESFEESALALTGELVLPELLAREPCGEGPPRWRILTGVTLGAARTEFDQLVVLLPQGPWEPVEVLAAIEVKRNINDLAHGFRMRQENLAWLTGATDRYDLHAYRTNRFPSGHFDRAGAHQQEGETFCFARSSFRRFLPDPDTGQFLDRMYFITRLGTMWGVSTAMLSRIAYRVATDPDWQPDSDSYLGRLLHWCRSLREPIETPDVLRMYTSSPGSGNQVLIIRR